MNCQHSNSTPPPTEPDANSSDLDRRALIIGSSLAAAGLVGYPLARRVLRERASVFVARNQEYQGSLVTTIRDGLVATGLDPKQLEAKRVLLKPNLVEPSRTAPHMTTHPAVIQAAADVFRGWGAQVIVGEGPGHLRDTELALSESGVQEALDDAGLEFADLNYEEVTWVKNAGRASKLPGFYFPRSVVEADLVVSLPKMKTHHWVGVTASLKNMYGVIPGIKYGWPKNVLHHAGIPQTVFDINASLPRTISIVDGIVCMEGDGPIMGTPKQMGLIVIGTNPTAVDATVCRLMQINPARVSYLRRADGRLGPVHEGFIDQQGEGLAGLASPFVILDEPHLRNLRDGMLVS